MRSYKIKTRVMLVSNDPIESFERAMLVSNYGKYL